MQSGREKGQHRGASNTSRRWLDWWELGRRVGNRCLQVTSCPGRSSHRKCRTGLKSRPSTWTALGHWEGDQGVDLTVGSEWLPTIESLVKAEPGYSTWGLRLEEDQGVAGLGECCPLSPANGTLTGGEGYGGPKAQRPGREEAHP